MLNGFEPLFAVLSPEQVNDLSNTIIQVLQGDQVSLSLLITQAASLASTFEQRDVILSSIITNLDGVVAGLSNRSAELDTLIAQTRSLMSGLYAQGQSLEASTDQIAGATDALVDMVGPLQPQLGSAQNSTTAALNLLVGNGAALDQAAIDLPPVLTALARFTSYGTYASAYICSLDVSLWGVLFPRGILTQIGGNSHSEVCR